MSYHKFRSLSEERISAIAELRRDLKALRAWDASQVYKNLKTEKLFYFLLFTWFKFSSFRRRKRKKHV